MVSHKVVWKDGLFVQPHHFQQSERYLLNIFQKSLCAYNPYYYGFNSATIDRDSLQHGVFSLSEASGIMPDGSVFSIPDVDCAIEGRSIEDHFEHSKSVENVYLALPFAQEGKPAFIDSSVLADARYRIEVQKVIDEVFGRAYEEIEVGKHNFTYRFGTESSDNYTLLQIARLKRLANGSIILDDTYIPPLLNVGASHIYCKTLKSLLQALHAKGSELLQGRRQVSQGFAEFASDELTIFGLLSAILTYTPLLDQMLQQKGKVHPYDLHTQLSLFAGALQIFVPGNEIIAQPLYNHNDIAHSCYEHCAFIKNILNVDYQPRCLCVSIEKTGEATYVCAFDDKALLETGDIYLGVSAPNIAQDELGQAVKRIIKLSSKDDLPRVAVAAIGGLPLNLVMNPPAELASKQGYVYFNLVKEGKYWATIRESSTIGFYLPSPFPDIKEIKLEMLVINRK